MRILHALDHSLPLHSGYVFRTLGILGAQRELGWQTVQLTGPRFNIGAGEETVDGWQFNRTPKPRGLLSDRPILRELLEMRALYQQVEEIIRKHSPDIVHAHSPVLTGLPALHAARKAGLPFVYEVRALWEDAAVDLGNSKEGSVRYRTTRALETFLLRRADAVITLCQAMRDEIASRGIDLAKITVVPNAVDSELFSVPGKPDVDLARQLELEGKTVLGFIGSFYHYEGLDLLLRALPTIRQAIPDVALLLVGGGPEEQSLKALTVTLGIGELVRFTGRIPHEDIRRYYRLVDFFVYPRRRIRLTELVTPLKPLEAMAEGGIVLASDVGGHRELIREGQTGYLFAADEVSSLATRITDVVRAPAEHPMIRSAAHRFVDTERNWKTAAANYAPVYNTLLAKAR